MFIILPMFTRRGSYLHLRGEPRRQDPVLQSPSYCFRCLVFRPYVNCLARTAQVLLGFDFVFHAPSLLLDHASTTALFNLRLYPAHKIILNGFRAP